MMFATAGGALPTRSDIEAMLASTAFRTVANLQTAALIVLDVDENIAFLNYAAERLSGLMAKEAEQRPFEQFLRRSDLKIDDWLSMAAKGRAEGVIGDIANGAGLLAARRVIPLVGEQTGYVLLTFQHVSPGGRPASAIRVDHNQPRLIFPPQIETKIHQAVKAHRRGVRILLLGESGVGKTAIAKHIHAEATSGAAPFVHVNCGSIPETLFESEMFGYERGAFTGALQAGKRGFIESAAGGTLFLDEVGEIPLGSQAKILKFLEDGTIQSIGSTQQRRIETRIITATNRDLPSFVTDGHFRRDLFFRIATFPVLVPSLRERQDVEQLLDLFLERANADRIPKLSLTDDCRRKLLALDFPGNIRELRSIIDYFDIVADAQADVDDLNPLSPFNATGARNNEQVGVVGESMSLREHVQSFEQDLIAKMVETCGSKREAARRLGIDVSTLSRKQARGDG